MFLQQAPQQNQSWTRGSNGPQQMGDLYGNSEVVTQCPGPASAITFPMN